MSKTLTFTDKEALLLFKAVFSYKQTLVKYDQYLKTKPWRRLVKLSDRLFDEVRGISE